MSTVIRTLASLLVAASLVAADGYVSSYGVCSSSSNDFNGGSYGDINQDDCSYLINNLPSLGDFPTADSEKCAVFSESPLIGMNCAVHSITHGGCTVSIVGNDGGEAFASSPAQNQLKAMLNDYQFSTKGASWGTVHYCVYEGNTDATHYDPYGRCSNDILCITAPDSTNVCRQLWSKNFGGGQTSTCN